MITFCKTRALRLCTLARWTQTDLHSAMKKKKVMLAHWDEICNSAAEREITLPIQIPLHQVLGYIHRTHVIAKKNTTKQCHSVRTADIPKHYLQHEASINASRNLANWEEKKNMTEFENRKLSLHIVNVLWDMTFSIFPLIFRNNGSKGSRGNKIFEDGVRAVQLSLHVWAWIAAKMSSYTRRLSALANSEHRNIDRADVNTFNAF